jgi:hypothetical protein
MAHGFVTHVVCQLNLTPEANFVIASKALYQFTVCGMSRFLRNEGLSSSECAPIMLIRKTMTIP